MSLYFKYLRLQCKRVFKTLPKVFSVSLALCLFLSVIAVSLFNMDSESEEKRKINIGIVGETDDPYVSMGVAALRNMDSSRFAMDVVSLTADEAEAALKKGDISAYAVIPGDFIENALAGDVGSISFYSSSGDSGIIPLFKEEIALFVEELMVHSQKGTYGMNEAMKAEGAADRWKRMNDICVEYLSLILSRSDLSELEILGISDELSLASYFVCGLGVFFLMLWGIGTCSLFSKRDMGIKRLLRAKGTGCFAQISAEFIPYTALMYADLLLIIAIFGTVFSLVPNAVSTFPELNGTDLGWLISFAVKMIPVVLCLSAIQFALYEAAGGGVGGTLLQFIIFLALGYAGGCLYPIHFLPKTMQDMSVILPSSASRSYMAGLFFDEISSFDFSVIIIYAAAALGLAAFVRSRRLYGREAGDR
ncbi:MAG: ABC transporter permease [Ruminococcaceae bacterium]|nr:ABC transporter permease [Oscillospiraceae bacterium]